LSPNQFNFAGGFSIQSLLIVSASPETSFGVSGRYMKAIVPLFRFLIYLAIESRVI